LENSIRPAIAILVEPVIKSGKLAIDKDVNETEILNYAMNLMPVLYHLCQMEKNFQQNRLFWVDWITLYPKQDQRHGQSLKLMVLRQMGLPGTT
jgi:hypothetical protein